MNEYIFKRCNICFEEEIETDREMILTNCSPCNHGFCHNCLSEWFKDNCKAEMEYFHEKNIPVFWGNSETYKQDMIDFIVNYTPEPRLSLNQDSLN